MAEVKTVHEEFGTRPGDEEELSLFKAVDEGDGNNSPLQAKVNVLLREHAKAKEAWASSPTASQVQRASTGPALPVCGAKDTDVQTNEKAAEVAKRDEMMSTWKKKLASVGMNVAVDGKKIVKAREGSIAVKQAEESLRQAQLERRRKVAAQAEAIARLEEEANQERMQQERSARQKAESDEAFFTRWMQDSEQEMQNAREEMQEQQHLAEQERGNLKKNMDELGATHTAEVARLNGQLEAQRKANMEAKQELEGQLGRLTSQLKQASQEVTTQKEVTRTLAAEKDSAISRIRQTHAQELSSKIVENAETIAKLDLRCDRAQKERDTLTRGAAEAEAALQKQLITVQEELNAANQKLVSAQQAHEASTTQQDTVHVRQLDKQRSENFSEHTQAFAEQAAEHAQALARQRADLDRAKAVAEASKAAAEERVNGMVREHAEAKEAWAASLTDIRGQLSTAHSQLDTAHNAHEQAMARNTQMRNGSESTVAEFQKAQDALRSELAEAASQRAEARKAATQREQALESRALEAESQRTQAKQALEIAALEAAAQAKAKAKALEAAAQREQALKSRALEAEALKSRALEAERQHAQALKCRGLEAEAQHVQALEAASQQHLEAANQRRQALELASQREEALEALEAANQQQLEAANQRQQALELVSQRDQALEAAKEEAMKREAQHIRSSAAMQQQLRDLEEKVNAASKESKGERARRSSCPADAQKHQQEVGELRMRHQEELSIVQQNHAAEIGILQGQIAQPGSGPDEQSAVRERHSAELKILREELRQRSEGEAEAKRAMEQLHAHLKQKDAEHAQMQSQRMANYESMRMEAGLIKDAEHATAYSKVQSEMGEERKEARREVERAAEEHHRMQESLQRSLAEAQADASKRAAELWERVEEAEDQVTEVDAAWRERFDDMARDLDAVREELWSERKATRRAQVDGEHAVLRTLESFYNSQKQAPRK